MHGWKPALEDLWDKMRPSVRFCRQIRTADGLSSAVAVQARTLGILQLKQLEHPCLLAGCCDDIEATMVVSQQQPDRLDPKGLPGAHGHQVQKFDHVKVGDKRIGQFDKGIRDGGLWTGHQNPLPSWFAAGLKSSGWNRSRRSTTERATSVSLLLWP